MSSLLITQAHLLDPVAGELSDASWLEVADGRSPRWAPDPHRHLARTPGSSTQPGPQ